MKLISWNVNGLRAAAKKGFMDFFYEQDAEIFAIQETKMQPNQKEFDIADYYEYWFSAIKKGYSGTLIYTKKKPLSVNYGIDGEYMDEGRVITLEFSNFYFINVYVPNSQRGLERLDYRMEFEDCFRAYLSKLKIHKPVIICGDLNVAHTTIDLKYPKANEKNAGYSIEERIKFQALLDSGYVDTFRYLYPTEIQYTWWSYMFNSRQNNIGWRIDYFLVSEDIKTNIQNAIIYNAIPGSDHCPVGLIINL